MIKNNHYDSNAAFREYIERLPKGHKTRLAAAMKVTAACISKIASGQIRISPAIAVRLEQITNGELNRKNLRPDDWEQIWPELIDS